MENNIENTKEQTLISDIIKTILKTLFVIVVGVFFCMALLTNIMPKNMANFYGAFNLTKAQAYCYKKQYKRTEKIEDLYNAIELSVKTENYADILEFAKEMQNKPNYPAFCDKINQRNTKNINKALYIYVCDYDAFIRNQIVQSLFYQSKTEDAKNYAILSLEANDNVFAWEIGTFVDLLLKNQKSSSEQKTQILKDIYASQVNGNNFNLLIENKLNSLPEPSTEQNLTKLKIYHAKQKIFTTKYYLEEASGATEATLETILDDIKTNKNLYNQTLSEIE